MNQNIKIALTFSSISNLEDKLKLEWLLLDHPLALMWIKLLSNELKNGNTISPRFSGFNSKHFDMNGLGNLLNLCIDVINSSNLYQIKERFNGEFNQSFSNIIHHHFEILVGSYEVKSNFWKNSSDKVREAILGLNYVIHDMEALDRAYDNNTKTYNKNVTSCIVHSFPAPKRLKIPTELLKLYEPKTQFGDLYLDYAQIGKTWLEVYLDQDPEIFIEAIRPPETLSAQFDIFLGNFELSSEDIKKINDLILASGKSPNDPRHALGFARLAKLQTPYKSEDELKKLLEDKFCTTEITISYGDKNETYQFESYDLKIQYLNNFKNN